MERKQYCVCMNLNSMIQDTKQDMCLFLRYVPFMAFLTIQVCLSALNAVEE